MHDTLTDHLGSELANDLSRGQREEVEHALTENPEGVRRVATQTLADYQRGDITNPAGILISRLRRGQHQRNTRLNHAAASSLEDRVDAAYTTRLAAHPNLGQRAALEYAVDYHAPGRGDLEHLVAQRHGIPTHPQPERNPLADRWQSVIARLQIVPAEHPVRRLVQATQPQRDQWTNAEHTHYLEALEELL